MEFIYILVSEIVLNLKKKSVFFTPRAGGNGLIIGAAVWSCQEQKPQEMLTTITNCAF